MMICCCNQYAIIIESINVLKQTIYYSLKLPKFIFIISQFSKYIKFI